MRDLIDDVFIIFDDVGASGHTEWRQEVLMDLIDYRYESMLPTVFTTNLSPKEVYSSYGPRIGSRLFSKENTILFYEDMPDLRLEGK